LGLLLRRKGFTGRLSVVGDEPWLPYQRPPLLKKFLAGALERERLWIRPTQFYTDHSVFTHLGRRVNEISREDQRVMLDDGSVLAYDALLLATGSRPRPLPATGAELRGVHFLRTIGDVERIRPELECARRLVVIGGGYIGLEVAATSGQRGLEVTVLEMADRVMNRVTCGEISAFYHSEHVSQGVRIVCNAKVRALAADPRTGRVRTVLTDDGAAHPADLVIVGVSATAVDELAVAAGLECANGIVVDQYCRTSDPAIFAAGDCTSHPNPHYGRRVRLESVDNAFEQGTSAALNMLGTPVAHDKVPWFWSDQYDMKLIIVGLCQGYDTVVTRGDRATRSFSACYLKGGELIAIDSINRPKDQMAARKLIAARARPSLDNSQIPALRSKKPSDHPGLSDVHVLTAPSDNICVAGFKRAAALASAGKGVVHEQVQGSRAWQVEAFDAAFHHVGEVGLHRLRRQARPQQRKPLRPAGDDADVGDVALVAAARPRQTHERESLPLRRLRSGRRKRPTTTVSVRCAVRSRLVTKTTRRLPTQPRDWTGSGSPRRTGARSIRFPFKRPRSSSEAFIPSGARRSATSTSFVSSPGFVSRSKSLSLFETVI
jgi:3-phenylpropionate/trans-cinnamate dioxygenase ferredoxin reductase component